VTLEPELEVDVQETGADGVEEWFVVDMAELGPKKREHKPKKEVK
jgi:hypothetical protein